MSDRPTSGGFSRHFINAGVKLSSSANPSTSPPAGGASSAASTNASIQSKSAYIPPSMSKKAASPPPPHFERQSAPVFHSTSTSTPISNSVPNAASSHTNSSSVTNSSSSPFIYNPSAAAPSFFQHLTGDLHISHATPPVPRPTVKLPKDSPLLPKGVHTLSNTYHPKPAGVQVLASSTASSRGHSEPSSDGEDADDLHAAERKMLEDVSFFRERRTAAATVESLLRDKREQEKLGEKLAKARAKDMATINSILTPPPAAFLHSSPPAPVSSAGSNQESPNPSQRASPSPTQQLNYPAASVAAPSASSSSALDMSLITSLTQRLSTLEKIALKQAKNLGSKDVIIADLQAQVKSVTHSQDAALMYQLQQELNEAREENAAYKKQVTEMETFLNDYGLVWVGFRAGVSTSKDATIPGASTPDDTATASTQATEGDEKQPEASPSPTPHADGALPPLDIYFDVGQFMASVSELNSIATEGNNLRIHTTSSGVTKFLPPQSLDLILYRDGMWFRNGPLRSWSTLAAKEFVRDVMEGYFPYELKEEYPDGICLAVIDKSKVYCHEPNVNAASNGASVTNFKAFAGKGNRLDDGKVVDRSPASSSPTPPAIGTESNNNRSASPVIQHPTLSQHAPQPVPLQAFLNKLPEKIVGKNGKLIEVRGEINKVLGQKKESSPSPTAVPASGLTVTALPSTSPVSSSPPTGAAAANVNPILVDTPALKLLRAREAALLASSSQQDGKTSTPQSLASVASTAKAGLPALPPIATLLIKMDPSDSSPPLLLKLLCNASIREVHEYVLAHRKSNTTQYELRSTYPARHYSNDDQRTIEEAGLTPNCNLFVRNKRPVSGYRQRNLEQKPDESWSVSEPPQ